MIKHKDRAIKGCFVSERKKQGGYGRAAIGATPVRGEGMERKDRALEEKEGGGLLKRVKVGK